MPDPGSSRSHGLRYMAASALFFSLMSLVVKLAGGRLPTMELVLARALVVSSLALLVVRRRRLSLRADRMGLLVARSVVGFLALTCYYYGVVHLPLAEATVIHFTNPVFTALIAAPLLGEALRGRELGLALLSLVGVVVVAQPASMLGGGPSSLPPLGVASVIGSSILAAFAYVLVRQLRHLDAMVVVFYFAAVSVVLSVPFVASELVVPNAREWPLLVAIGATTFLGQVFMTRGLQLERAGPATAVGYLQIVFASLWGVVFFADVPRATTIIGATIIVGCTLLLMRSRRGQPAGPA